MDSVDAAQGVVRASLTPSRAPWTTSDFEISSTTIGLALPGAAGSASVTFQQSLRRGSLRVFGGGAVGRTSRSALDSRGTGLQVGLALAHEPFSGAVSLHRATTNDWQLMEASGFTLSRAASAYAMRDARVDVTWRAARVQLTASGFHRSGLSATRGTASGYAGAVTWQLNTSVQMIAHSGRQLADPLRGIPQANYAGLTARWQRHSDYPIASSLSATRIVRNAEYTLEPRAGGAELVVRINAPIGAVVETASDVSEWIPARMSWSGTQFEARIALSTGTHRVAVRVNGGRWRAPRGLVRVDDEFGGAAGIVVVP